MKVTDKEISTKEKTGETSSIPYGMAVWSTGIGQRPVVRDFMKQVGQVCHMIICLLLVYITFELPINLYSCVN